MRLLVLLLLVACARTSPSAVASADELAWPWSEGPYAGLLRAGSPADEPPAFAFGAIAPTGSALAVPGARWVGFCQAREDTDGDGRLITRRNGRGDRLEAYFATEDAPGGRRGRVVGWDESARWVVLEEPGRRGQRLTLVDTVRGVRTAMVENIPSRDLDVIAFAGPYLLLARGTGSRDAVLALIELETLEVREIDKGPGELVRVGLSEDGRFVWLAVVPPEELVPGRRTNRNERDRKLVPFAAPPFPLVGSRRAPPCARYTPPPPTIMAVCGFARFDERQSPPWPPPPPARSRVLSTSGLALRSLTPAEVHAQTTDHRFASEACRGWVLAEDPEGPGRLVGCATSDPNRTSLAYARGGARGGELRPLDARASRWTRADAAMDGPQAARLVRLDRTTMLDLRTGALRTHEEVGASYGRWYLTANAEGSLWRVDADRPDAPLLVAQRLRFPRPRVETAHLPEGWGLVKVLGGYVGVDLVHGTASFLGRDPVAVRPRGHVLVRESERHEMDLWGGLAYDEQPLPIGRLRWRRADASRRDTRRDTRRASR